MRNDGAVLSMFGRAATNPSISGSNGDRVSFRAVSTERRYDESAADWIDGDEFGITVVCWAKLGSSVLQLVRKGDPVVIDGRLSTRKFDRNGNGTVEYFTECKADHVAIDVGRAAGRIVRNAAGSAEQTVPTEPAGSAVTDEVHQQVAGTTQAAEVGDPFQDVLGMKVDPELEPAF
ncbi:single-strand DNA-binding protein [Nakamurella sp. UYEF19]|uniref:single-stranded DNA-binding protein n=1 Tax=Nakamurella sp. UYEF19 TaxID=1756392 RepID=UPI0033958F5A